MVTFFSSALTTMLLGGVTEVLYRVSALGRKHFAVRRARKRLERARERGDEFLEESRSRLREASRNYVRDLRENRRQALTLADLQNLPGMPAAILEELKQKGCHRLVDIDRLGMEGLAEQQVAQLGDKRSRGLVEAARRALREVDESSVPLPPVRDPSALPEETRGSSEEELLRSARQWFVDRDHVEEPKNDLTDFLEKKSPEIRQVESRSGRLSWFSSLLFGDWTGSLLTKFAEKLVNRLVDTAAKGAADMLVDYGGRAFRWLHRRLVDGWSKWAQAKAPAILEQADESKPESLLSGMETALSAAREDRGRSLPLEDLYGDYQRRNAHYVSTLANAVAEVTERPVVAVRHIQGGLPKDVVDRVECHGLELRRLRQVEPRSYQLFGMKYLLVQERTLLGDEMGLGKTLQALGVMAHLSSQAKAKRFLVVAPASVTINWTEEARRFSKLPVRYLTAPEPDETFLEWKRNGGLAVISFTRLRMWDSISPNLFEDCDLDFLAVDEAQKIKNADTKTAVAVQKVVEKCRRVSFMTGTPIENRLREFKSLIGRLQPQIAEKLDDEAPIVFRDEHGSKFRQTIAPVYLRRNQKDVLSELPGRIDKEEWVEFEREDLEAFLKKYRGRELNLGSLERQRIDVSQGSAKLQKLKDILKEHLKRGQKILLFSRYLDVLQKVGDLHSAAVTGTIRGGVSQEKKASLQREFMTSERPCILLLQIDAGGLGINLQEASAVVIMEPQWTYTKEEQAIRRAYRMGQTRPVEVHRLLTKGTIEEDIHHVKNSKKELHEIYSKHSSVQEALKREIIEEILRLQHRRKEGLLRG